MTIDWSNIRVPDGYHPSVSGSTTVLQTATSCDVCNRPTYTLIRFDCEGKASLYVCGACYDDYQRRYHA